MKKYFFQLPFLLLLCSFTACRKDLLHWQNVEKLETNTTERLNRIMFLANGKSIICAGGKFEEALILTSDHNADNWIPHLIPDLQVGMLGMTQTPDGKLFFCGEYCNLVVSEDTGNTFKKARITGLYETTMSVAFIKSNVGFAVTNIDRDVGAILTIDTLGNTINYKPCTLGINEIKMLDDRQTGYVIGNGAVMQTTDAGSSWQTQNIVGDNFNDIYTSGATKAWICGYNGSVYKTTDAGANWTRLRNGNDITKPRYHFLGILFTDDTNGYAVGEGGLVSYTNDAGKHWMEFDHFTDNDLKFIAMAPDGKLITGGDNGCLYKLTVK